MSILIVSIVSEELEPHAPQHVPIAGGPLRASTWGRLPGPVPGLGFRAFRV